MLRRSETVGLRVVSDGDLPQLAYGALLERSDAFLGHPVPSTHLRQTPTVSSARPIAGGSIAAKDSIFQVDDSITVPLSAESRLPLPGAPY